MGWRKWTVLPKIIKNALRGERILSSITNFSKLSKGTGAVWLWQNGSCLVRKIISAFSDQGVSLEGGLTCTIFPIRKDGVRFQNPAHPPTAPSALPSVPHCYVSFPGYEFTDQSVVPINFTQAKIGRLSPTNLVTKFSRAPRMSWEGTCAVLSPTQTNLVWTQVPCRRRSGVIPSLNQPGEPQAQFGWNR